MIDSALVTGAILAGGKSTRMGQDKALLSYNNRAFIQHIAETLARSFAKTIILSDRPNEYLFLQLPMHNDVFHDSGPLGGIHAALTYAPTPMVFVSSCDTPFITTTLIETILAQSHPEKITIVKDDANTHPLIGIYPKKILAELTNELRAGNKSVHALINSRSSQVLVLECEHFADQLRNINTRTDYNRITAHSK
jgi:molybdenum cofactor guanylyltransferase